jgi:hypothetical protein
VPAPLALPELRPNFYATNTIQAQAGVDACDLVEHVNLPVVTLEGDIMCGFGWWSYLPMGCRFRVLGHTYEIVNRLWLDTSGGVNVPLPRSFWGASLDLHTCDGHGSTLTWASLVD